MATTSKPETIIALWLDPTGDPSDPKWIVSRDRIDPEDGGAITTDTVDVFDEHDYDGARAAALALGREEGRRVEEIDLRGVRSTLTD